MSDGELAKLTMTPTVNGKADKGKQFVTPINPNEIKRKFNINFQEAETAESGKQMTQWKSTGGEELEFNFILDDTGVLQGVKKQVPVQDQVNLLKYLSQIVLQTIGSNDAQKPTYIEVAWGSILFKGLISSLSVNYTMFSPQGEPVRASVDISFNEYVDPSSKDKTKAKSNADAASQNDADEDVKVNDNGGGGSKKKDDKKPSSPSPKPKPKPKPKKSGGTPNYMKSTFSSRQKQRSKYKG